MKRYFMGDPHFGHGSIITMMARVNKHGKLFSCQEEHDEALLDEINARVCWEDELIVAGDFAFDHPGKYRAKIKCKTVGLIRGNHDKYLVSVNTFGEVPDVFRTKARMPNDYFKVFISHYPHSYWDGSHRGWAHVYGHCHGQREEFLDDLFPGRRAMDVGVDNIYRLYGYFGPISEQTLYEYMAPREGHDDIRYYHDYQAGLYAERGLI